jgi:hypothetical protein
MKIDSTFIDFALTPIRAAPSADGAESAIVEVDFEVQRDARHILRRARKPSHRRRAD